MPDGDSFLSDNLSGFLVAAGVLQALGRLFYSVWLDYLRDQAAIQQDAIDVVSTFLDRALVMLGDNFNRLLSHASFYLDVQDDLVRNTTRALIVSLLPNDDTFLSDNLADFLTAAHTLHVGQAPGRCFYSMWLDEQARSTNHQARAISIDKQVVMNNATGTIDSSSLTSDLTRADGRQSSGGSAERDAESLQGRSVLDDANPSVLPGLGSITVSSGGADVGGIEAVLLEPATAVAAAAVEDAAGVVEATDDGTLTSQQHANRDDTMEETGEPGFKRPRSSG